VKKILLLLITVFLAYLTAFYVTGTKNGYQNPLDFEKIFNNLDSLKSLKKNSDFEKGLENLDNSEYDKAMINFKNALKEENTDENNYYVGYTYFQKQDYKNALVYFNTATNLNSENSDAWLQKGITEYYQNNYQEAINDLFFCTELIPEESQAYYYLSLCYEAQGKIEVALQSAETAVEYDSTDSESWFEAANLAYSIQNYSKSIKYYKKVLEILPKDKYTELNLGLAYNKSGNKDSALFWYTKTIEDYPDYSLAYNNKGYIYQTEGKYQSAISYYTKSIKLDIKNTYPIWNRADCYFELKEYEKAIKDYKKAYEIKPEYYNALWYIGLCHEKLNNKKDAILNFKDFIKNANTDNEYYQEAIQKIKINESSK